MSHEEIRVEVLSNIFDEQGIAATPEAIASIASDFAYHMDMEREQESYQFTGAKQECSECKALRAEVTRLESSLQVFCKNVRQRHGLSESAPVYTENGRVLYDRE